MRRLANGKFVLRGYRYKNYEIRNHGYFPPERCVYWEAVNINTGCADFHAPTRKMIKRLIDEDAKEPNHDN